MLEVNASSTSITNQELKQMFLFFFFFTTGSDGLTFTVYPQAADDRKMAAVLPKE